MDLTIESSLLRYAASVSGSVTPTRTTLPVLCNVLISAAPNGKLQISGTNAETSITNWVTAQVTQPGEITVPEDLFSKLLSEFETGKEVHLSAGKNMILKVECGTVCTEIKGIAPEEFPVVVMEKLGSGSIIPATEFKKLIQQVGLAASSDADKAGVLAGIHFGMNGTELTAAATDQYRLARKTIAVANGYPGSFVVPAAALDKVARAMNTVNPDVEIHVVGGSKVVWNVPGKLQVISSQLAGSYPKYQSIIPTAPAQTTIVVDRRKMLTASKTVKIFSDLGAGLATLAVSRGQVSYSSFEDTSGNANVVVENEEVSGADVSVSLNARFFQEAIEAFVGDTLAIGLNGVFGPVLVTSPKEEKLTQLLMPMRLQ